jgi:signal transduction histidine kinase
MESEIRQVVSNLVRNSIDSMHGRGGRLLIRSREATHWPTSAKGVLITVADTGSGIDPDTMRQLYTAFFSTKGIGGTGLGLWVSSEIVKRHHGHLRVRSGKRPDGAWTIFELFRPYQGMTTR